MNYMEYIMDALHWVGYFINLVGVVVVLIGFFSALLALVSLIPKGSDAFFEKSKRIRANLGVYILFGLEFMIAADIIHTFLNPNLDDLLVLALVVAIRTTISYFLGKEIKEVQND